MFYNMFILIQTKNETFIMFSLCIKLKTVLSFLVLHLYVNSKQFCSQLISNLTSKVIGISALSSDLLNDMLYFTTNHNIKVSQSIWEYLKSLRKTNNYFKYCDGTLIPIEDIFYKTNS